MQKYLVFDYKLRCVEGEPALHLVETMRLDPQKPEEVEEKSYGELGKEDNFRMMVIDILNYVNAEAVTFHNVLMVSFDANFFQKVLVR
jgi:hypothetical protein